MNDYNNELYFLANIYDKPELIKQIVIPMECIRNDLNRFILQTFIYSYKQSGTINLPTLLEENQKGFKGKYNDKEYMQRVSQIIDLNNYDITDFDYYQQLLFEDYKEFGGLPYLQQLNKGKIDYINNDYDSILLKDVVRRYDIRDLDFLERLIYFLIDNIGHTFSANSISKFFKHEKRKANPEKVLNYIKLLRNALLFTQVKREDLKGKEILSVNEKYYLMDHGFYKALIGDNNHNEGQKLENIVFNELLRRGYKITVGIYQDYEIDFICKKNNRIIYVQVSETLKGEETRKREFKPLMKIKDNYPKYIITEDITDYSKQGIINLNIIDFLKDESI